MSNGKILYNFVGNSNVSGESAYDVWKSLNPLGTPSEFIEFLGNLPEVTDTLEGVSLNKALSENQGRVLNEKIMAMLSTGDTVEEAIDSKLSEHNSSESAHNDIREELNDIKDKLGSGAVEDVVNASLEEHNTSKTAHADIRESIVSSIQASLVNYYLKSESYSKDEVNSLISSIPKFGIKAVSELPTTGISDITIYLLTTGDESQNLYTEYIYVDSKWEKLGTQTLDLSGYETTENANSKLAEAKSYTDNAIKDKADRSEIPAKLSDLEIDMELGIKNWNDLEGKPDIATDEDILSVLIELDAVNPIASSNNEVYTAENGSVYIL